MEVTNEKEAVVTGGGKLDGEDSRSNYIYGR